MEVIEETCLDTKAQIFQHEVGHAEGKNIYYDKPKE
jgi:peptide deformylase